MGFFWLVGSLFVGFFLLALCFSSTLNYFKFLFVLKPLLQPSASACQTSMAYCRMTSYIQIFVICRNCIGRCLKTSNLYFGHTANMLLCQISKTDEHCQLMTDHLLKRVNGSDWSVNLALPQGHYFVS